MGSPTNPLEGQGRTKISKANDHAGDCDWHLDQYPWKCTCGAAWPEHVPSSLGDIPTDYTFGTVVQMYDHGDDRWLDIGDQPLWLRGVHYRYQPTTPRSAFKSGPQPILDDPLTRGSSLPEDDGDRLAYPMFDGLLAYFPNALAEVAMVSMLGNQQHNPGQPMHWARGKSTDHANKAVRHLVDHGKRDARGVRHTARAAWRILALLQEEIEHDEGRPLSRASRPTELNDI